jgi:peptide/nickel transport system substrate-binding protein
VAQTALAFIASPTAWDAAGDGFGTAPVGAGPYLVSGWDKGTQLRLERNESYWSTTHLDEITVKYIPDETQRLNTFTTGAAEISVTGNVRTAQSVPEGDGTELLKAVANGGFNLFFNTTRPPFDDIDARRAVVSAFDAEAWNEALFGGAGELAPTVFLETSPLYSNVPLPTADREAAQELFDKLAAAGTPLEFTVQATPTTQGNVEWFQTQLASFDNVKMEIEPVAPAQLITDWRAGNFSMGLTTAPRFADPFPAFHNTLQSDGVSNYGKYSNPAVDDAFRRAAETTDVDTRRDAYEEIQAVIVEDLPVWYFGHVAVYLMYDSGTIHGIEILNDGVVQWDKLSHE